MALIIIKDSNFDNFGFTDEDINKLKDFLFKEIKVSLTLNKVNDTYILE